MKNAITIDAADLCYHPDNKVFSAELTELVRGYPDWALNERILVKGKTDTVAFWHDQTKRDREGDIQFWRFMAKHKGQTYQLKVFND